MVLTSSVDMPTRGSAGTVGNFFGPRTSVGDFFGAGTSVGVPPIYSSPFLPTYLKISAEANEARNNREKRTHTDFNMTSFPRFDFRFSKSRSSKISSTKKLLTDHGFSCYPLFFTFFFLASTSPVV